MDQQRCITQKFAGTELKVIIKKDRVARRIQPGLRRRGFFFQGFFFLRPEIVVARDIPASKLNSLRLLKEAASPELQYGVIEQILKQEPSLLYKLLRYLNSPALGLSREVRSVPPPLPCSAKKNSAAG